MICFISLIALANCFHLQTYGIKNRLSNRDRLCKEVVLSPIKSDTIKMAGNDKWQLGDQINESLERFESLKTAIGSAVGGSIAVLPYSVIKGIFVQFNADWYG